jgi:trk system potassium uptake protein TrkA
VNRVAVVKDLDAEVISFEVGPRSPLVDVPLAEAGFPADAILAAIVRGTEVVVPRGSAALRTGDEAIVFALSGAVAEVTALFPA